MNILIDKLPESVFIDGQEHHIHTDFRICVLFELLMQDKDVPDREKLGLALGLFFDVIPTDTEAAIEFILWFYKCGKEESEKNETSSSKKQAIYSFVQDDEYIYSAFLDQYRIDLNTEYLHWWKFKALFKSLKEDTEIVKIMGYRAMEIDSDMSKEQQKHYRKLKELYALPDQRTEEEKETDFNASFSGLF